MSKGKVTKVSTKHIKKRAATSQVRGKPVAVMHQEKAKLIKDAAKLAIELHRDALKELERH